MMFGRKKRRCNDNMMAFEEAVKSGTCVLMPEDIGRTVCPAYPDIGYHMTKEPTFVISHAMFSKRLVLKDNKICISK